MLLDSLATVSSSHDTEWDKNEVLGYLDPDDAPSWLTVAWVAAFLLQRYIRISNLSTVSHYKAVSHWTNNIFYLVTYFKCKNEMSQKLRMVCEIHETDLWIKMYLTFSGIYFKGHKVSFYSSSSQSLQRLKKSNGLFQWILHLNDTAKYTIDHVTYAHFQP